MQTLRITTPQNIDIDYEIAGVGERLVARLIDWGLFILVFLLGVIVSSILGASGAYFTNLVLFIIFATLYVFYDLACETFMNGQSLGKRVMKIKVASLDGARPTLGQYILRWLFRIVDFAITFQACGLICAAVTEKQQRVGDIVAGTVLIKTSPRTTINTLAFAPVVNDHQMVFSKTAQLSDNDISLIQEVITTYLNTGNTTVVYNTARHIRSVLGVADADSMDDLRFLQTVIKDYNYAHTHENA